MKVTLLKVLNVFLLLQITLMCLSLAFVNQALMSWRTGSSLSSDETDLLIVWSPPMFSALVLIAVVVKELRFKSIQVRLVLNVGAFLALLTFAYGWLDWSLSYV